MFASEGGRPEDPNFISQFGGMVYENCDCCGYWQGELWKSPVIRIIALETYFSEQLEANHVIAQQAHDTGHRYIGILCGMWEPNNPCRNAEIYINELQFYQSLTGNNVIVYYWRDGGSNADTYKNTGFDTIIPQIQKIFPPSTVPPHKPQ